MLPNERKSPIKGRHTKKISGFYSWGRVPPLGLTGSYFGFFRSFFLSGSGGLTPNSGSRGLTPYSGSTSKKNCLCSLKGEPSKKA